MNACNKDLDDTFIKNSGEDEKVNHEITSDAWSNYSPLELSQIYNEGIDQFAISLAKNLKNKNLRLELMKEALIKIDGDYDIMWKDFKNKEIQGEKMNYIIAKSIDNKLSLENNLKKVEQFSILFKQLQISIPVNIEKWDIETSVPLVAFRQATDTGFDKNLITYDERGNRGLLDGDKYPDMPVVVINLNERSDSEGIILPEYYKFSPQNMKLYVNGKVALENLAKSALLIGDVPSPQGVSGQYINDYILLSWYLDNIEPGEYIIEIEKEINGTFNLIDSQSTYGGSDSYIDNSGFEPGTTYLYRLRTKTYDDYGSEIFSPYSQVVSISVQTPGLPAPTNVNASIVGPNNLNLTWDYPSNQNITGFIIRRRRPLRGESFENDTPTTVPYYSRAFADLGTKVSGDQYQYEIRAYNSSGLSLPSFDITHNPYRSQDQHVYIKTIEFLNIIEFEDWDLGLPEIELTVAHGEYEGDFTPIALYRQERMTIFEEIIPRAYGQMNAKYGFKFDVLSDAWYSDFYKQVLNFNFIEYDGPNWFTGWKGVNFKVSIPLKIGKQEIKIEAATDITFNIRNTSVDMGSAYLKFWDPQEYNILVQDDLIVGFSTVNPFE